MGAAIRRRLGDGRWPMADGNDDDGDNEYTVVDRVDDPVVADPQPVSRATLQLARRGWPWILAEKRDPTLDPRLDASVDLLELSECCWAELDGVCGHAQPRSCLTVSQGMLWPSSAIVSSNAAMSRTSSNASSISSYRSALMRTAVGFP